MRSLHLFVSLVICLLAYSPSAFADRDRDRDDRADERGRDDDDRGRDDDDRGRDDDDRGRPEACIMAPPPAGYVKKMTFYADSETDDFMNALIDPLPFWRQLGRTDAEIDEQRSDAIDFYMSKFGIDAEQLIADGRATLMPFMVNPDGGYRALDISGEAVGREGWTLYDTGWQLMITDPDGVMLGGDMPMMANMGAFMIFGEYFLYPTDVPCTCPRSYRPRPIIIEYRSGCPIHPDPMGMFFFVCDISHPVYGEGQAGGVSAAHVNPDGSLRFNTRNVVTFPAHPMEAVRPHQGM
ncbi:MAG: hypothetical protein R3F65_00595 [bacterium]